MATGKGKLVPGLKGFNGVVFGKAAHSVSAGAQSREASHGSDRTESLPVDPPHRRETRNPDRGDL